MVHHYLWAFNLFVYYLIILPEVKHESQGLPEGILVLLLFFLELFLGAGHFPSLGNDSPSEHQCLPPPTTGVVVFSLQALLIHEQSPCRVVSGLVLLDTEQVGTKP